MYIFQVLEYFHFFFPWHLLTFDISLSVTTFTFQQREKENMKHSEVFVSGDFLITSSFDIFIWSQSRARFTL